MRHYITHSDDVKKIIKSLDLTRHLSIASIVIGESGTGKRTLVRHLFPDLPVVNGADQSTLEQTLEQTQALIIEQYEKVPNPENLSFEGKHIIAIANHAGNARMLDETFAFIYTLPPLRDRPEDIALYADMYRQEAERILQVDEPTPLDPRALDIRENLRSLRASVYREVLLQSTDRDAIERGMYHYFTATFDDESNYHALLGLFERPLLQAGLDRYGSQLQLAEALGINRNTLRKKIHERLDNA